MNDYLETRELYHHGIKGQKWGVRRFQNEDGSLTDVGKKRYGINEFTKEVNKQINSSDVQNKIRDLRAQSDSFNDQANKLGEKYDEYYKSLLSNKSFDDEVKKALNGVDEFDKWEIVDGLIDKYMPVALDDEYDSLYKNMDNYWDSINDLSNTLFSKYKDSTVKSLTYSLRTQIDNGQKEADAILRGSIDGIDWNGYLYRHFDDYWKNDRDSRYAVLSKYGVD